MEKPTDSGRGEKRKREGEGASPENAPWPQSKCSSKGLEIMEQDSFCGQRGNAPGGVPRVKIFPAPKILKSFICLFSGLRPFDACE